MLGWKEMKIYYYYYCYYVRLIIMYKFKTIVFSKEILALQIIVLSKEVLALQSVKPINCMLHAYCCNYNI